jgi:hypothetical protein
LAYLGRRISYGRRSYRGRLAARFLRRWLVGMRALQSVK